MYLQYARWKENWVGLLHIGIKNIQLFVCNTSVGKFGYLILISTVFILVDNHPRKLNMYSRSLALKKNVNSCMSFQMPKNTKVLMGKRIRYYLLFLSNTIRWG